MTPPVLSRLLSRPHPTSTVVTCALLAVLITAGGSAQAPPVLVIRGATVFPITAPPIERGMVVVTGGTITAVGRDLPVPAGATVVDATGGFLLPGLVDPHSHLGLGGESSESTDPLAPQVRVADAFDVDDPMIARTVAAGITTTQVFPGSSNVIGGEGVVVKLKPGRPLAAMLFPNAPRLMKMAVGENPKGVYGRQGRMPSTRMGEFAILRDAFVRASAYRERWDAWRKQPEASRGPAPARDAKLDPLADILRGTMRVHIHAYRRDEFLNLMALADEFGFRIASFQHAMESYKVPEELARHGIAVSLYPDAFGRKIEHWDQIPQNAALMQASGVLVSLHSDFPSIAQRLHIEAAKLLRYGGFTEATALQTITINAARVIGVEREVGSLEPGKHADLALFDKHPFDSFSLVRKTWIDGELVFDRQRDSRWLAQREWQ